MLTWEQLVDYIDTEKGKAHLAQCQDLVRNGTSTVPADAMPEIMSDLDGMQMTIPRDLRIMNKTEHKSFFDKFLAARGPRAPSVWVPVEGNFSGLKEKVWCFVDEPNVGLDSSEADSLTVSLHTLETHFD